nr:zinc finger, CCHC-type [Tanacetum cinerariifolium]
MTLEAYNIHHNLGINIKIYGKNQRTKKRRISPNKMQSAQVLKKFNYFDCTPVSTPMDTSEKLVPNNGQTEEAFKKQTCITGSTIESEVVSLAAAENRYSVSAPTLHKKTRTSTSQYSVSTSTVTPPNWVATKLCPGALLHNTIAQDMRERPLNVSFENTLTSVSAQDLLSTGTIFSDLNSFMLNSNPLFNIPGFNVQEFKPAMGFQFHENGGYQEDGGRMMFPFKVMNQQLSSTRDNGQVFVPGPSENLGGGDDDDDDGNDGSNGGGDGGD